MHPPTISRGKPWLKPLAVGIGVGFLGLVAVIGLRKVLTALVIERILSSSAGVHAVVHIASLGLGSADLDLELPEFKMRLRPVKAQWWVRSWFPFVVQANADLREAKANYGGLDVVDAATTVDITVNGTRLTRVLAEATAVSAHQSGVTIGSPSLSLLISETQSRFRGTGRMPWGPVEVKFEGPALRLRDGAAGEGQLLVRWPKGSATARAAFQFDSGFHQGNAHIDGLKLRGSSVPGPLQEWTLGARLEKKEGEGNFIVDIPPVSVKGGGTQSALPLKVDFGATGARFSGSARGNPWAKYQGFVAGGLDISGEWEWATGAFRAQGELTGASLPGTTLPLNFGLTAQGTQEKIKITGAVTDLLRDVWMSLDGSWSSARGFVVDFQRDFLFAGGKFDLSNVLEGMDQFKSRAGTLKLSGRATWNGRGEPVISARATAEKLGFDYAGVPFDGFSLDARVSRLWPLRLVGKPRLTVDALGSGIPFLHLVGVFSQADDKVKVERLTADFADGGVAFEPFLVALDPLGFETVVVLDKIHAESLVKEAAAGQIQAKGALHGRIPFSFKEGFLYVKNGILSSADEKGWIQYKDPTLQSAPVKVSYLDELEALLAQGQQALAFKALDNFFFKTLQIRLERSPLTQLEAYLTLSGHNPDLANGMPFQFQIALTGQLENAVKQSLLRGLMRPEAFTDHLKKKQ